jgi:hypothetical protein
MKFLAAVTLLVIPFFISAKTWEVGPGKLYVKPSQVSTLVSDGDTVLIQSAEYVKDVCIWRANKLALIGVGGYAKLNAEKTAYGGKAIWVIAGNDTYVENIEFLNCEVVDLNGAGIRLEGKNLTVRSCYFHNNQEGILAGDNPESDVVVEYTEFGYNGAGDGYSHNIYINHLRSLLFQYNYVHHSFYGHEVKSRAYKNVILYNRITNEDGSASYEIDLPNGGQALVMGNIIQQSKFSDNNTIISYGREGLTNPGPHNFYFLHNTVVNNEDKGIALNIQSTTDTVFSVNNLYAGPMSILVGIPKVYINQSNVINTDPDYFHFKSVATYDYHLSLQSPGIDSARILNQTFLGIPLNPTKEYVHPLNVKDRFNDTHPDIGCFELQQVTRNSDKLTRKTEGYFIDALKSFFLMLDNDSKPKGDLSFFVYDATGKLLISKPVGVSGVVDLRELQPGNYYYRIYGKQNLLSGTLVVTH